MKHELPQKLDNVNCTESEALQLLGERYNALIAYLQEREGREDDYTQESNGCPGVVTVGYCEGECKCGKREGREKYVPSKYGWDDPEPEQDTSTECANCGCRRDTHPIPVCKKFVPKPRPSEGRSCRCWSYGMGEDWHGHWCKHKEPCRSEVTDEEMDAAIKTLKKQDAEPQPTETSLEKDALHHLHVFAGLVRDENKDRYDLAQQEYLAFIRRLKDEARTGERERIRAIAEGIKKEKCALLLQLIDAERLDERKGE